MKTYVVTTGAVFGLLALAHLLRIIEEGTKRATDPYFLLITALAAGLSLWACRLIKSNSAKQRPRRTPS